MYSQYFIILQRKVTTTIIIQYLMRLLATKLITVMIFGLLIENVNTQAVSLTSCIEYSGGVCIRCSMDTHLFQGICYHNILGCISYLNGTTCTRCDPSGFVLNQGGCSVAPGVTLTAEQQLIYKYGDLTASNPGDRYGQSNFMPTTLDTVKDWPTFLALNTYILKGQYSHYISRMSNPIFSVHYYIINQTYSYKILYYGSGGGLFLCIADVFANMNVQLRSLTPISASDIIDFCSDYDTYSKCLRCNNNYHLENSQCYPNMGGCVKYRENICIECLDYYFLLENRCISDCVSVSDARSVLYYENSLNTSTLSSYYGISITQFYSFSITQVTTTVTTTVTTASGGVMGTGSNSYYSTQNNTSATTSGSGSSSSGGASIISVSNSSNEQSGSSTSSSSSSTSTSNGGSSSSTQGIYIFNSTSSQSFYNSSSTSFSYSTTGIVGGFDRDPNCASFDSNGACTKCSYFYWKNPQNICQQVNPLCASYNQIDGSCQTCFPSYTLQGGQCVVLTL